MIDNHTESFFIAIYRQCLSDLSWKWKISIPLLDYNLARLQRCAQQCLALWQRPEWQDSRPGNLSPPATGNFSIDEIPLALEFYLQIDGK